ncbi:MAG TPA: hypothetical protein VFH51_00215, partial [Myxococcota bacterium]|nr:hypothetical protein [Myxococcota bacterium]
MLRIVCLGLLLTAAPSRPQAVVEALGGAERYLAHVSTDKPIYRAGETVYGRAVVLESHSHGPCTGDLAAAALIKGPRGDVVARGPASGSD